jgi:hypothetical protein
MPNQDQYEGTAASFRRCPVWVPQDPNVPHFDRLHCILTNGHQGDHAGDERFTGLHHKYDVTRRNDPEGKHAECRYFVLDPQHDPLAREALETYSDAAFSAGYIALSKEIDHWIGREMVPAHVPSPEHSGSPFKPCKLCDAIFPGRGGKPGAIGGCMGAERVND